jgi:predicted nucleic-acid-binding protein
VSDSVSIPQRFLDTNVILRYLTRDHDDMAIRATRTMEREGPLYLTDVVIVEAAYVMTTVYRFPREDIVDGLMAIVQRSNIAMLGLDKATVLDALLLCRPSGRVSFADAMIWAAARSTGSALVYSFDARFPTTGIQVQEPD